MGWFFVRMRHGTSHVSGHHHRPGRGSRYSKSFAKRPKRESADLGLGLNAVLKKSIAAKQPASCVDSPQLRYEALLKNR